MPANRIIWREIDVSEDLHKFEFTGTPAFNIDGEQLNGDEPVDFYLLFVDHEIQDMLVNETNRYAEQKIVEGIANESLSKHSLLTKWEDTNRAEVLRFLAIIMWMGLDTKPELRDYWSTNPLYKNDLSKRCGFSRNKFELFLHCFHMSDNENLPPDNRLYKISPLITMMNNKFQKICEPNESVCIDETMVPFRGRLSFLQYVPGKRHKYGIKLFKLCIAEGYTYAVKVYGGKEQPSEKSLASRVVMELMQPLLNTGRTLFTDNFYTSVELAHELNRNNTHLVGTLRAKRKHNPKAVIDAKLKRGEIKSLQSNTKVIVGKWKDKRDVRFLTTKDPPSMIEVKTRRGPIRKPSTIVEYNAAKAFVDMSDQKAAYNSSVRRSVKWYRKVAIELLTNTAIVNAHVLYKYITRKIISITSFREKLVLSLLNLRAPAPAPDQAVRHSITQKENRGRCTLCYKHFSEREGRQSAMKNAKKVHTYCPGCPSTVFMCIDCFFDTHTCNVKK